MKTDSRFPFVGVCLLLCASRRGAVGIEGSGPGRWSDRLLAELEIESSQPAGHTMILPI
jgi:hypothetical protein